MMVGLGGLRDIKDGKFSVSVFFFHFEISKTFFFLLQVLNDSWFWWVTRSQ